MVHCFSLGHLLGRPGSAYVADHGLRFLWEVLRDTDNGGYRWTADHAGGGDPSKQAYGHAFVLLAASTALVAERPGAEALLSDVTAVLEERFWDSNAGLYNEEFSSDWTGGPGSYRGGNSNMHMTEALLAAHEATGRELYLDRAESVARQLIADRTASNDWWLAEHYTSEWHIDREYNHDDPHNLYRPYGSVIGHAPEWTRLLLTLYACHPTPPAWLIGAASRLFDQAVGGAWDQQRGGLAYTVDFDGRVLDRDRYSWPISEAIGAASLLVEITGDDVYEAWYRRLWDYVDLHLIDHRFGGWFALLDENGRPKEIPGVVIGKPDLYHALQSCLAPLIAPEIGLAQGLAQQRLRVMPSDMPRTTRAEAVPSGSAAARSG